MAKITIHENTATANAGVELQTSTSETTLDGFMTAEQLAEAFMAMNPTGQARFLNQLHNSFQGQPNWQRIIATPELAKSGAFQLALAGHTFRQSKRFTELWEAVSRPTAPTEAIEPLGTIAIETASQSSSEVVNPCNGLTSNITGSSALIAPAVPRDEQPL